MEREQIGAAIVAFFAGVVTVSGFTSVEQLLL